MATVSLLPVFCNRPNLKATVILQTSHGRRTVEVLDIHAPHLSNWACKHYAFLNDAFQSCLTERLDVCKAEGQIPLIYGKDAVEIPGSRNLLDKLEAARAPWAIVTSGTRPLVTGWLNVMNLAQPEYLVSAEQVTKGKPDPECYRLGAKRLGVDASESSTILVLEDSPAGVRAGKAAGYRVVALATTHSTGQLRHAGANWVVKDLRSLTMTRWNGKSAKVSIEIRDALVA